MASAVVSYPIGKEYFQEKSVAGKDIEITIEKGSTSRDVSAILKKKGIIRYEAAFYWSYISLIIKESFAMEHLI